MEERTTKDTKDTKEEGKKKEGKGVVGVGWVEERNPTPKNSRFCWVLLCSTQPTIISYTNYLSLLF
ncbi:hypothetical protein A2T98_19655 [Nodularia spumigena CENA596]|uniref:Uncharacterized protein n=1 Tax=Nodularia spumigena CENA596 TaxID=1819295 RepID=A0A161UQT4_NODSP|nr:hypothetical protein A2T98_19655 [Nodularia spumigena CENA596]